MQIDKQQILQMLRSREDDAWAGQADSELPDQVDLLGGLGGAGGAGGIVGKLGF